MDTPETPQPLVGTTYHVGSRDFPCLTFALRYAHALERLGARPQVKRDDGSVAYHAGRFYDAPPLDSVKSVCDDGVRRKRIASVVVRLSTGFDVTSSR